ncbi:hypothetical protein [Christiangramia sabulilitoris]|uniref:Uncharacterized protein n=1 Tax=Christiangramia sabulilitoris TaxID=2583991 RepID=A0A550I8B4_9FLAO|nr:hypothetical protein [Christiangramia sabulilitoris]TRO67186.1 hypothetical protein FGM01_04695 [Christiangramia sabulilitoris]
MKDSSGKRNLVKKYVADFVFSEKTRFVLDGTNYQVSSDEPGGKFIKFRLEKSKTEKKRKLVFKVIYKMMKNFQSSLN